MPERQPAVGQSRGFRWWTFVSEKYPGHRWYWHGRWGVDWHWPRVWHSTFWLNQPPAAQIVKTRERIIQVLAGTLLALATVALFMLGMWISSVQWPLIIQLLGTPLLALVIAGFFLLVVRVAGIMRDA